jgi:uncharacterized protein
MKDDKGRWNPYVAGALAGLLMVASIWFTGKYVGASTTFVRSAGMIQEIFSPEAVQSLEYFSKNKPIVEWQWMFVTGILLGSLISSLLSGSFRIQAVPDSWRERFGPSVGKRGIVAFAGGIIAMYGARLADG